MATSGARFDDATRELSVSSDAIAVLNVGDTDDVLIVELGQAHASVAHAGSNGAALGNSFATGDGAFLSACRRLMPDLAQAIEQLLSAVRQEFPGMLREGLARKWVNLPHNFLAITIQPRDASFAIHIKGRPERFEGLAPSLEIKQDRPSYSRFKLSSLSQLPDATRVVMCSARGFYGPREPQPTLEELA